MFQTVQAKLVFVFAIVLLIAQVLASYVTWGTTFGSIVLAIAIVFGVPLAFLLTYDTNCLVVGKCSIWSWIRSALYMLMTFISVVLIVYAIVVEKKNQQKINTEITQEDTASPPSNEGFGSMKYY